MARMTIKHEAWGEVNIAVNNSSVWHIDSNNLRADASLQNYFKSIANTPPAEGLVSFYTSPANRKITWLANHLENIGVKIVSMDLDTPERIDRRNHLVR